MLKLIKAAAITSLAAFTLTATFGGAAHANSFSQYNGAHVNFRHSNVVQHHRINNVGVFGGVVVSSIANNNSRSHLNRGFNSRSRLNSKFSNSRTRNTFVIGSRSNRAFDGRGSRSRLSNSNRRVRRFNR